jgi:hypothetical protein
MIGSKSAPKRLAVSSLKIARCSRVAVDSDPTLRRSLWVAIWIRSRAAENLIALGVYAALEAIRTLRSSGYETFAPVEVVNWTNEKGARFAPALISSGIFAGVFKRDWAASQQDRTGITFGEALDGIGYRGSEKCGAHPLSAFFEVHIEQGLSGE